jgi:hypothetical protein
MNVKTLPLLKTKTSDGLVECRDDIPLGKQFTVDIDMLMVHDMFNVDKRIKHQKLMVWDVNECRFFPAELLGIDDQKIKGD